MMTSNLSKTKLRHVLSVLLNLGVETGIAGGVFLYILIRRKYFKSIFVYFLWYIYSNKIVYSGDNLGWKSKWFRNSQFVFKDFLDYFDSNVICDYSIDKQHVILPRIEKNLNTHQTSYPSLENIGINQCLFGIHPHGFFQLSAVAAFATNMHNVDELIYGHNLSSKIRIAVANLPLNFPLAREYGVGFGTISVNRSVIIDNIRKGNSIVLVPGGGDEALVLNGDSIRLVLKERLGFMRIAQNYNIPIIPVLCFGESNVFDIYRGPDWVIKLQMWLLKKMGVSIPLILPNFNQLCWFCPKRCKITVVLGRPVYPTDISIDDFYQKYIDEIKRLHSKFAPIYGNEREQKLEIISSEDIRQCRI